MIEDETVIDIDAEQIDSAEHESIDERWYSAAQVQRILGLNKAALQKAITKLTSIYSLNIHTLRRGGARATEYSHVALEAIKLLNTGKFGELRKLVGKPAPSDSGSASAIVFVGEHHQVAASAASVADNNLAQISSFKSGLLNNYRELGRALGKQAAAEVRLGFTEEVKAALSDLQES
ncbi:MAG: hypothetical protein JGK17_06295 [Microcoleus sp. PH2017_10_PVI_O_A]|uniref:hypothetical protein n=1 Tax=unclassified Microcoleus TaxID=2642155 RepID=UPI001D2D0070|nr:MULTISPECIES: hypothetical protein [unclassified Microcoleus]TAE84458.1 MAG: hypothetical protein EAZ83_05740 [Oscillatoriales cyanobacterium]MCC3405197.1 hypothetical protein [Microcoleus sp. PH2017_10_PVI_O_A]MCC3459284.1 hypothetical protein [Microcoleus sp. PH2017_11_PCY_U_A]MCC3477401.1 hypothetical protein [Microcoleus sp. PH2017_12_PCY_D_A]MCC3558494.1 hypothetical protein [Microcoleus sp. PH2017_27_LUM_O_A]